MDAALIAPVPRRPHGRNKKSRVDNGTATAATATVNLTDGEKEGKKKRKKTNKKRKLSMTVNPLDIPPAATAQQADLEGTEVVHADEESSKKKRKADLSIEVKDQKKGGKKVCCSFCKVACSISGTCMINPDSKGRKRIRNRKKNKTQSAGTSIPVVETSISIPAPETPIPGPEPGDVIPIIPIPSDSELGDARDYVIPIPSDSEVEEEIDEEVEEVRSDSSEGEVIGAVK